MPFRDKAKSLFKTKSRSDSLSKTSTKDSDRERWPSNVYKPGEPMPRPKYRAIPKKEHKEKLEAFSFAEAWRRKSFNSQYSPMGTRAPSRRNSSQPDSRRNSIFSLARRSISGKSDAGRTGSVTSAETEKSAPKMMGAAKPTTLGTEPEQEGDDDVTNGETKDSQQPQATYVLTILPVGVSRMQSQPKKEPSKPLSNAAIPPMNTAHDHQPFTEHDLTLAMQRSHLAVPAQ